MSKRRGFTLVELLIVIVVIAILAAFSIVAYNGMQKRAYSSRAQSELSAIGKGIQIYHGINEEYPPDVSRNIPGAITPYLNGSADNWPIGPWPGSVYDYDYFIGSDGEEVSQISIRFCPIGGPMSACIFPNEDWADGFTVDSSAYWCVAGKCRSHPSQADTYPGYCFNCR